MYAKSHVHFVNVFSLLNSFLTSMGPTFNFFYLSFYYSLFSSFSINSNKIGKINIRTLLILFLRNPSMLLLLWNVLINLVCSFITWFFFLFFEVCREDSTIDNSFYEKFFSLTDLLINIIKHCRVLFRKYFKHFSNTKISNIIYKDSSLNIIFTYSGILKGSYASCPAFSAALWSRSSLSSTSAEPMYSSSACGS